MHHVIEYDEQCQSCKGTGLYVGLAEQDGSAVVCYSCKGTGCHHAKIEYDDFEGRKDRIGIHRVFATNPGIVIGEDGDNHQYRLSDFGGMPYKEWEAGLQFPSGSEMREFTCPTWWYQTADYDKKPDWEECWESIGRSFSQCPHFADKEACWARWDEENNK